MPHIKPYVIGGLLILAGLWLIWSHSPAEHKLRLLQLREGW